MSCKRFGVVSSTFILCAGLIACGKKETGPPPRYAFVGFENLSGDGSLDWAARGESEYLARSLHNAFPGSTALSTDAINTANQTLGVHSSNAPGDSAERTAAIVSGANHVVAGYIEHAPGGVRITATDEDIGTNKTTRTVSATAATAFEAIQRLAHQFSERAAAPPTTNAEAFRIYSTALESQPSNATPLLERAVALDPNFGLAWLALTRTIASSGDRARTEDVIAKARSQKLAPIDSAFLNFDDAALRGDKTATLAAMQKVAEFDPNNRLLARTLAGDETTAGNFRDAAAQWKRLTTNDPDDADAWNQLGYSLGWSGDYSGASAAIHQYASIRPNDANPLDSLGDIDYWFGKYADAAESYAAAYTKSPAFLTDGDLYKEAWAKFRAGDKPGADAAFAKFQDARVKAKDITLALIEGDWLYRTGRVPEASALLRTALKNPATAAPVRPAIAAQLAVWDLITGNRAAANQDLAAGGTVGATPGDLLVRFAAQPSAPTSEWEARASRLFANPELAGLRLSALGYALILDGKKQDAISVWEQIGKNSAGNDFFPGNILARLKGQSVTHQIVPDPLNTNQFNSVLDKL